VAPFTPAASNIKLRNFISLASSFLSSSFNILSFFSFKKKQKRYLFIYLFIRGTTTMSDESAFNLPQSPQGPANPAASVQGQVADVKAFID